MTDDAIREAVVKAAVYYLKRTMGVELAKNAAQYIADFTMTELAASDSPGRSEAEVPMSQDDLFALVRCAIAHPGDFAGWGPGPDGYMFEERCTWQAQAVVNALDSTDGRVALLELLDRRRVA